MRPLPNRHALGKHRLAESKVVNLGNMAFNRPAMFSPEAVIGLLASVAGESWAVSESPPFRADTSCECFAAPAHNVLHVTFTVALHPHFGQYNQGAMLSNARQLPLS